jgi:hypothetical protein
MDTNWQNNSSQAPAKFFMVVALVIDSPMTAKKSRQSVGIGGIKLRNVDVIELIEFMLEL